MSEPRAELMGLVSQEIVRARTKFPGNEHLFAALVEEVGELAKALLDEGISDVEIEAIQVACVAIRIAEEWDPSFNNIRDQRGLAYKTEAQR